MPPPMAIDAPLLIGASCFFCTAGDAAGVLFCVSRVKDNGGRESITVLLLAGAIPAGVSGSRPWIRLRCPRRPPNVRNRSEHSSQGQGSSISVDRGAGVADGEGLVLADARGAAAAFPAAP